MTVKVTSDALYVIATVLLGGGVIYALVTRGAVPGPALGIGMLVLFIAAALNLIDERRKRQSLHSDKTRRGIDIDQ